MKKLYILFTFFLASSSVYSQACDSLFSTCVSTFSRNGYYFDLEAVNQVNVVSFSYMVQNAGTRDVQVYYRKGTYLGFEGVSNNWVLLGTQSNTTPTAGTVCPLPINAINVKVNVCIPQGQKYGFYVVVSAGTGTIESHSTLTEGSIGAQDVNLKLITGKGQGSIGAFTGTLTGGLTYQGGIQYDCGCTTSTPDELNGHDVSVYPNPSNGIFNLQGINASNEITVYNVLGETVYHSTITQNSAIDISNQAKGIYFLKVESGEKVYTQKIIIQ